MTNKHVIVNETKSGYKYVTVPDEYFITLDLEKCN